MIRRCTSSRLLVAGLARRASRADDRSGPYDSIVAERVELTGQGERIVSHWQAIGIFLLLTNQGVLVTPQPHRGNHGGHVLGA